MKIAVNSWKLGGMFNTVFRGAFYQLPNYDAISTLAPYCGQILNKYGDLECHYIGEWDNEDQCIAIIARLLSSKLAVYAKYFYDLDVSEIFNQNLTNAYTEQIDKSTNNDTFSMGEQSPITAPSNIPDIKSGASGIDTPSNKARGRYVASSHDTHLIDNPDYHMKMKQFIQDHPGFAEIIDSVFRTVLEEYTKIY